MPEPQDSGSRGQESEAPRESKSGEPAAQGTWTHGIHSLKADLGTAPLPPEWASTGESPSQTGREGACRPAGVWLTTNNNMPVPEEAGEIYVKFKTCKRPARRLSAPSHPIDGRAEVGVRFLSAAARSSAGKGSARAGNVIRAGVIWGAGNL